MAQQTAEQIADTAVRVAAPLPLAVTGLSLYGIGMQDWVYIATLILTLAMIAEKLWKWWRAWRRDDGDADE